MSIHLFGELQIRINDQLINGFDSLKTQALLIYLAVARHSSHRREVLAEMFWPEKAGGMALRNLRQALANLRKAIGDRDSPIPFLLVSRTKIQFNPDADLWLDCSDFKEKISKAASLSDSQPSGAENHDDHLKQAAEVYTGDFLINFYIDDCPEFSEWVQIYREKFRRQAIAVYKSLVNHLEKYGDREKALNYCRLWAELDHWGEEAHRQLMRLLTLEGYRDQAISHYSNLSQTLSKELELEPEPETTEIFRLIQDGIIKKSHSPMKQLMNSNDLQQDEQLVCVARENELTKLKDHLNKSLGGSGQIVFITGNAGSGKTTLIQRFIHQAIENNPSLLVATGACNAFMGIGDPYLPFRDIMGILAAENNPHNNPSKLSPRLFQRIWAAFPFTLESLLDYGDNLIDTFVSSQKLISLAAEAGIETASKLSSLIEIEKRNKEVNLELEQIQIFEQFTNVIQRISTKSPIILVIEDVQWADKATTSLLFHLGHRIHNNRILILASYRNEEISSSIKEERHPIEPVINEIKRRYGEITLVLDNTSEKKSRNFVNGLLDHEPNQYSDVFRDQLYRQTGGHPLFTVELLHHLKHTGKLIQDGSHEWIDQSDIEWNFLPAKIEAVIEERTCSLDENLLEILFAASVEGDSFTTKVVSRILSIEEIDVIQLLSSHAAHHHQIVKEVLDIDEKHGGLIKFRFNHILFQQFLYSQLSFGEKRILHGKIADSLEELTRGDEEILSYHYLKAGNQQKALKYLTISGKKALKMYAYEEAESYFRSGLDLVQNEILKPELLSGMGEALYFQGQFDEASKTWKKSFKLYKKLGDTDRSAWAFAHMVRANFQKGNMLAALNLSKKGIDLFSDAPQTEGVAFFLHETARVHFFNGIKDDYAIKLCEQANAIAKQLGSLHVQAESLITLGGFLDIHPNKKLSLLEEAADISESLNDLDQAARAYNAIGVIYSYLGELEKGIKYFQQSSDFHLKSGNLDSAIFSIGNRTLVDIHIGNLIQASENLSKFDELAQTHHEDSFGRNHLRSAKGYLLMAQGDLTAALEIYQQLWDELNTMGNLLSLNEIGTKLGWTLIELGEFELAEDILNETLNLKGKEILTWFSTLQAFLAIMHIKVGNLEKATFWLGQSNNQDPTRIDLCLIDTPFQALAEAHILVAQELWDQAFESFIKFDRKAQQVGIHWWCVRAKWDLAEAYISRNGPGDRVQGVEVLQDTISKFMHMGADGWVQRLETRLKALGQ